MVKMLTLPLNAAGLENSRDVLPVYLGDDRTDEDAFVVSCFPVYPFCLLGVCRAVMYYGGLTSSVIFTN